LIPRGPVPDKFPFSDEEIKARKVGVSKMQALHRAAYAPAAGSPLIHDGDPADGPGSFIVAIGAGKNPPNDRFGKWGLRTPP
jgi:hypothetical protein